MCMLDSQLSFQEDSSAVSQVLFLILPKSSAILFIGELHK